MLLRSHGGLLGDVRFRYLAAKCLAELDEWDEVLGLLGDGELDDDMQDVRVGVLGRWRAGARAAEGRRGQGGQASKQPWPRER